MLALALALFLVPSAYPQEPDAPEAAESADRLVAKIPKNFAHVHMAEQVDGPAQLEYLPFTFSPDGSRVAFLAAKKDRVYGFLDGEDIGWGDMGRKPVFSENGEHIIMALGKSAKNRSESWVVYVDGDDATKEDWVGPLTIANDGEAIAYWSKPGFRLDTSGDPILNRATMILGKRKSKRFRRHESETYAWANTEIAPLLNEDGSRAIGTAYDDLRRGLVLSIGDSKDEVLHSVDGWYTQTAYSNDLKRVATVRRVIEENVKGYVPPKTITFPRYVIQVDGQDIQVNADASALPEFSRNGEHYSFVYLRDKQFGLGIDGQLLPPSENLILDAKPDSAGGRIAWIEHRDGDLLENLWLNRNMQRLVYQGKSHLCEAYVGEKDGALVLEETSYSDPYDKIYGIHFSPDEQRVAFLALEEQSYFVVCRGQKIGPFEEIDQIRWVDNDTVAVGTREGDEFWWRSMKLDD
ncbi:hypothetical protein Poly30_34600 [Planctomycetes bacterium Poly30]|uniref:Translocation protein TolB n=1 Tax=Saltatorellus ferox TaxID=2528018 RepID=A0A518EUZ7_9BACT|nr:hypothetical protein Poly30_34600 [Planctomycetes bacterium Poly30]